MKDHISSSNGNREELSQFANSFLAMCGNGLVSKETPLLEESLPSQKLRIGKMEHVKKLRMAKWLRIGKMEHVKKLRMAK